MNNKTKSALLLGLLLVSNIGVILTSADTFIESFWVSSDGTTVISQALESGKRYRIEAREVFEYNDPGNLCADAMYYTTEYPDGWNWVSYQPCPDGHSFLQINGDDVDWGPFSNGDTYHTYTILYAGEGEALTFQIIDWIDGDYSNNHCHLEVSIHEILGGGKVTGGGQCIVGDDTEVPSASFGFNAMWFSRDAYPKGELNYIDHTTGMHVHIHDLTYLEVWEDLPGNKPWPLRKARFEGPCTIDGVGGYYANVYVEDNGEPGTFDKFQISLSTGYVGGSDTVEMLVGNIQIHKPPK